MTTRVIITYGPNAGKRGVIHGDLDKLHPLITRTWVLFDDADHYKIAVIKWLKRDADETGRTGLPLPIKLTGQPEF